VAGSAALIEIERKDKTEKALSFLQEVQRDPITDKYLHVDLREVKADEKFEIASTPLTGESFGVKNQSGVLETPPTRSASAVCRKICRRTSRSMSPS